MHQKTREDTLWSVRFNRQARDVSLCLYNGALGEGNLLALDQCSLLRWGIARDISLLAGTESYMQRLSLHSFLLPTNHTFFEI